MANSYVVTGNGFVKDKIFDVEKRVSVIIYTQTIVDAKVFSSSGKATKFIEFNFPLVGWVWQPYRETSVKDLYEVVKTEEFYSFNLENKILPFRINKSWALKESDAKFLNGQMVDREKYLSKEDAIAKALKLNEEALEAIVKQIEKLKKESNETK